MPYSIQLKIDESGLTKMKKTSSFLKRLDMFYLHILNNVDLTLLTYVILPTGIMKCTCNTLLCFHSTCHAIAIFLSPKPTFIM